MRIGSSPIRSTIKFIKKGVSDLIYQNEEDALNLALRKYAKAKVKTEEYVKAKTTDNSVNIFKYTGDSVLQRLPISAMVDKSKSKVMSYSYFADMYIVMQFTNLWFKVGIYSDKLIVKCMNGLNGVVDTTEIKYSSDIKKIADSNGNYNALIKEILNIVCEHIKYIQQFN